MSPFCMALLKPEDWQTLARGGKKASGVVVGLHKLRDSTPDASREKKLRS